MARPISWKDKKSRWRHRSEQSLEQYVDDIREYLIKSLGWSYGDAETYTDDPEKFRTDWKEGTPPDEIVDTDLDYCGEHGSEGDGAYD
jgi:hypothetical protein